MGSQGAGPRQGPSPRAGPREGPVLDGWEVFAGLPTPYLLLTPDLVIHEVNRAYLATTQRCREDLLGRYVFDAFPANPDDPFATGVANLRASFHHVLTTGRPHSLAVQRYDIPVPGPSGQRFAERYWSPVNSPILDEQGRIRLLVHRVEDITELVAERERSQREQTAGEFLRRRVELLEADLSVRAEELRALDERLRDEDSGTARGAVGGAAAARPAAGVRRGAADASPRAPVHGVEEVLTELLARLGALLETDGLAVVHLQPDEDEPVVVATDDGVGETTRHQLDTAEGPAHQAVLGDEPVVVEDLEQHPWARRTLAGQGMRSTAAVPLRRDGHGLGVVQLYRRSSRPWTAGELETAQALADLATGAITRDHTLAAQRRLASQLQDALDGRVVIEQAKGVLAERHGTTPSEAFEALRRHARSTGRGLRDVAQDVIAGRRDP